MLEHYVDVVGVLDKGYGVYVGAFVVGECLGGQIALLVAYGAVVEALDVAAYHGRGGAAINPVALQCAGQPCVVVGVGHYEVFAHTFAAPCHKAVLAGIDVEVHHVFAGLECFAALTFLPYDVACGRVDEVEGHGIDFVGKGVGPVQVHVENEASLVVRVAVALVVVDKAVAGGCRKERGGTYGLGDYGVDLHRVDWFICIYGGFRSENSVISA